MQRFICVHGHFYQPPRENPWLESVEVQDSAFPYHDWNERITAECYGPNGQSRILNERDEISELVNNYSWMSFNFGPTLLSWLESQRPDVYQKVLEGDKQSQERFSGHGSAIAQAYNHMILPLANDRDAATQILWGIADFQHRFGRAPEGMWLAETAVDTRALELMAKHGIKYTILAPHQSKRIRRIGDWDWRDTAWGNLDPTMPYLARLPSGATITVFIYDGPISRSLAFEGLLNSGDLFAERLRSAFRDDRQHPQIVNIATDGETYGHHRIHAEMALSYAIRKLSGSHQAQVTNYGEYLARHPPTHEIEVFDHSSWSCIHGVERWKSDCGCNSGMRLGWRQHWRGPLRAALDWLRDEMARIFDAEGRKIFRDPWEARDAYVAVVLDRGESARKAFLDAQSAHELTEREEVTGYQLLEMQRHAMLMYTSCGWFFDELSGIETVQVMQYAARGLQLARQVAGEDFEPRFLELLAEAKSNIEEIGDGRNIYLEQVKPAMVDLGKVASHYAISSLFERYGENTVVYSHDVRREDHTVRVGGRRKMAFGRIHVRSRITQDSATYSYGVLHLGDHNVSGGIRAFQGLGSYEQMKSEIVELFLREDVPDLIRAVDRQFGAGTYSLRLLFRDEQQKIVRVLMDSALQEAAALYRSFNREYGPLARFLTDIDAPVPDRFRVAIAFSLHEDLQSVLSRDDVSVDSVSPMLEQIRRSGVSPEVVGLEFVFRKVLQRAAARWQESPDDADAVNAMERILAVMEILPFKVNLWAAQNSAYETVHQKAAGTNPRSVAIAKRLRVAAGA